MLKERTHRIKIKYSVHQYSVRLHNLGNWLIGDKVFKVKGQGFDETQCYNGGGMHLMSVVWSLTCYILMLLVGQPDGRAIPTSLTKDDLICQIY